MLPDISDKTVGHIEILFEKYGTEEVFGRTGVESTTGLRSTRASEPVSYTHLDVYKRQSVDIERLMSEQCRDV